MPKENKQVSVNQIDKMIMACANTKNYKDDKESVVYPIGENEVVEITITPLISIEHMNQMVKDIADVVCADDSYNPALYSVVFGKSLIGYYTNLKTSISNDKLDMLVYLTDVVETIAEHVNQKQLFDIRSAASQLIDFRKQEILSAQRLALTNSIYEVHKAEERITIELDTLLPIVEKMATQFNALNVNQLSSDISKIATMDERKRIDTIIELQKEKENLPTED